MCVCEYVCVCDLYVCTPLLSLDNTMDVGIRFYVNKKVVYKSEDVPGP